MIYDWDIEIPTLTNTKTAPSILVLSDKTTDSERREIMDDIEFVQSRKLRKNSNKGAQIMSILETSGHVSERDNPYIHIGTIANPAHMRAKRLQVSRHGDSFITCLLISDLRDCRTIYDLYDHICYYKTGLETAKMFQDNIMECQVFRSHISDLAADFYFDEKLKLLIRYLKDEEPFIIETVKHYVSLMEFGKQ